MYLTRLQKWGWSFIGIGLVSLFVVSQLSRFSNDASLSDWNQGFDGYLKASREQVQTDKPMALFFYTDWCSSCKALRENILASPEVREHMGSMLLVKVNPEYGPVENQLAEDFGVLGYPSFFVVDVQSGKTTQIRRTSNITPQQFVEQLVSAVSG